MPSFNLNLTVPGVLKFRSFTLLCADMSVIRAVMALISVIILINCNMKQSSLIKEAYEIISLAIFLEK